MPVLKDISRLAQCLNKGAQTEVHIIEEAALVWTGSRVKWVGKERELPLDFRKEECVSARGALVVPGLIDCHTHLCFAGWRAEEFEQRLLGRSYLDIAKAGGGILSTVAKTRLADADSLKLRCEQFLKEIYELGVTTLECKSGYGLDLENEIKVLEVYDHLRRAGHRITSTLLAAHTFPTEFAARREDYIKLVCNEIIPQVAQRKLASFCDVFLEESAFSYSEAEEILECGLRYGLRSKIHADQLTDSGGAKLAAKLKAISADHLEKLNPQHIPAMKQAGVIAVALPVASLYTKQPALQVRSLIEAGVEVAVATDFNPGSAPTFDLQLAMMLACTMCGMTPTEVLKGVSIYAAKAIGLEDQIGSLEPGKLADFAVIDAPDINHWMYNFTPGRCRMTYRAGEKLFDSFA